MKKSFCLFFVFVLFSSVSFVFADASVAEKKFIRGNIKEKIEAVQQSDEKNALKIGIKGIDYALENIDTLGSDSELSSLAEASLLALMKKGGIENLDDDDSEKLAKKIFDVFNEFYDENVKISAVDCLLNLKNANKNGTTDILNKYLEERYKENHPGNLLIGNIIMSLGDIGDSYSLDIIYKIWLDGIWPENKIATETSLVKLSENFPEEISKKIFMSDDEVILRFLLVAKKISKAKSQNFSDSEKSKKNFIENLAEISLSCAINNAESSQVFSRNFYLIQKESLEILASAKWSHAEKIVLKNFDEAKKEYEMKIISDEEFIEIINLTAEFSSPEIAGSFSNLLGEFNSKAEKTEIPPEKVVLALVKSLGELGDKTAFDNLLYATYLNYSDNVIEAAKDSLAKLKW